MPDILLSLAFVSFSTQFLLSPFNLMTKWSNSYRPFSCRAPSTLCRWNVVFSLTCGVLCHHSCHMTLFRPAFLWLHSPTYSQKHPMRWRLCVLCCLLLLRHQCHMQLETGTGRRILFITLSSLLPHIGMACANFERTAHQDHNATVFVFSRLWCWISKCPMLRIPSSIQHSPLIFHASRCGL